jgi:hypothetical protein
MIVKDHINKLSKGHVILFKRFLQILYLCIETIIRYGFITFRNSRDSQSVLNADPNQLMLNDRYFMNSSFCELNNQLIAK